MNDIRGQQVLGWHLDNNSGKAFGWHIPKEQIMTQPNPTSERDLVDLLAEVGDIANAIRARDGAPEGYSHEYFSGLVERISTACGGDILVRTWETMNRYTPSMARDLEELEVLVGKLVEAVRGLHDDNMDYLTKNHLGGENNHWMKAGREALDAATSLGFK